MVAIYLRVSTQEQANEGYSIGEQNERLAKYCEAMNWPVYKIYTDAGYSGGNIDRPALQAMIRAVTDGKIQKVVVYKLDRLSRSQLDTLYLIEKVFLANNCDFVSMSENFDTSTPFGRAMIGILAVFAQLEREQIKERMMMGKDARAKDGKYIGSRCAPFGYDYTNGELVPNEYDSMQVKMLFDMAQAGKSPYAIARYMNEHGYSRRNGYKWNHDNVRRTLQSKAYIGYIHYHDEWLDGIHEPIISPEQFYQVEKIMRQRSELHRNQNIRCGLATTYLGGFLYCAQCGAKYSKKQSCNRVKADGTRTKSVFFGCNSRNKKTKSLIRDPNCKNKNWKIEELTDAVFAEIKKLALDPDYMNQLQTVEASDNIPIIEQKISEIENQLSRLMDLYAAGDVPLDILQEKIHALDDEKNKLQNELERLKLEQRDILSMSDAKELVTSFEAVLNGGDFDSIRQVIGGLIERIELDGDDITIRWKFS